MFKSISIAILASALVSGCATGPSMSGMKSPVSALEAGKARVYFYRTGIIGAAYQPEVTLNGLVVGKATPRGVYFRDVPPGAYLVTTSMTKETVSFKLVAGQKQYVRLSYSFGFNIYPELVNTSNGESESKDLSYIAAH
ncbi:MAG: hypothetical protein CFE44_28080 [Burkholderiales bacterium PBB4]|nr:MAG: hypothetical protein CFE44_28080 [Burkholderiales bacterium PBB4]